MFLNRFIHNTKIINLQRPLKRHFSGNPRNFTNKFGDKAATLVGLGCSLTILSTFGFAYNQTKNSGIEEDADQKADSLLEKENSIITEKDESHRNGTEEIQKNEKHLKKSVKRSLLHLQQVKEEFGTPGLICAVSVGGEVVLNAAIGFSDVENAVKCNADTKMRIASISKALTSIGIGKLLQEGKIDLDAPIQKYVKYFPEKEFDNEAVTITTRQLMSHTSGIRHYDKNPEGENEKEAMSKKESNKKSRKKGTPKEEFDNKEYYIKDYYDTTKDAAKLFQDDPLLKKPGTDYLYSTHAWTLLSGVIEEASGMDYVSYMKNLCYDLGLDNTLVELNDPIIYNRSRNYSRDEKGRLRNSPYVDNSYKISGGGFLSTAEDLLKIGNVMLYCHQNEAVEGNRDGYLKKDTINTLWTIEPATKGKVSKAFKNLGFGLGWKIQPEASDLGCCRNTKFAVTHSGGAVGASSILLIIPRKTSQIKVNKLLHSSLELLSNKEPTRKKPRGIVIAIMVNMQDVGLLKTAFKIAENFEESHMS